MLGLNRIVVASHDPELWTAVESYQGSRETVETVKVDSVSELLRSLETGDPCAILMDEAFPIGPSFDWIEQRRTRTDDAMPRLIWVVGETTEGVRPGADGYLRKPLDPVVFAAELDTQVSVFDLQRRVRSEADIDHLTGLMSRREFRERFEEECKRTFRYRTPFTVILLSVDDLSAINEAFGESRGDRILGELATSCRQTLRDADVLSRWSGTAFAAILPETALGHGLMVAARLRSSLSKIGVEADGETYGVTVSVGVAGLSEDDASGAETLVRRAESAVQTAKEQGRNGVFFHTPSGCVRFAEVGVVG